MEKEEKIEIIKNTLKSNMKTILKKISIENALFVFIWGYYIFCLFPNWIEIFVDCDLVTKKNNYTILFDQGVMKKMLSWFRKMTSSSMIWMIKQMVFIWKPPRVKKDEAKLKWIFNDLAQWRFEYMLKHNNIKIFFTSDFNRNHIGNIMLAYNKINEKDKEIVVQEKLKTYKELTNVYFQMFFNNLYYWEEYFYITEFQSQGEKDTSNTPELFNDVFELWAATLWYKFNDKQIVDIRWNKLYYKKNNTVFSPFYIFKFFPKVF